MSSDDVLAVENMFQAGRIVQKTCSRQDALSRKHVPGKTHYPENMFQARRIIQKTCSRQDALSRKHVPGRTHYPENMFQAGRIIQKTCSRTPRLCCNVKRSSDLTPYRTLWFVEVVVIFQLCVSLL